MPDPMTAPIPSAVRLHSPSVFESRWFLPSESEISRSIDLQARSWRRIRSAPCRGRFPSTRISCGGAFDAAAPAICFPLNAGTLPSSETAIRPEGQLSTMSKVYFYYSAMNAGKSTVLLQSSYNYHERGMRTLLFMPAMDTRSGHGRIESRIGLASEAVALQPSENLFD